MPAPIDEPTSGPTDAEIALAYLRVAHIYRRAGLEHLALGYYALVANRFAHEQPFAQRARLGVARCAAAQGGHRTARRWLRSLLRDPTTREPLACHAALRLTALGADGTTTTRRVESRVSTGRFSRWCRIARAVRPRLETAPIGRVAEGPADQIQ